MAEDPQNKPAPAVTGYPAAVQPSYPPVPLGTAAAYPYAYPPPQANQYYSNPYPTPPPYNRQRATLFRRLIAAAIAVFVIIGAITFILWLVLRPHLPEVAVDSATVSPINGSTSLTANWEVTFFFRNPNKKMEVYYDQLEASVFYGSDILSFATLPPLYQEKKNETTVRAKLSASSQYVDSRTASEIAEEKSNGAVRFNFRLMAWIRFRSGAWRTRRHVMRVFCDNIRIGFANSTAQGTLSGSRKECDVDL